MAPVMATATAPVKFVRAIVAVNVAFAPCCAVDVAEESVIAMAGRAVTVTVNVADWLETPVAVPVTVKGY